MHRPAGGRRSRGRDGDRPRGPRASRRVPAVSETRLPCAVLGASGYIGQHFARLLADHPSFEPTTLVATERSEGRTVGE
ncbi:MAG TPA: hypothetical protein VEE83_00285, partial [Thermoplasmata archaeon]|nr:hypothetical protein [Thermoplasmata archaeon]